jgi:hypothetical protein
MDLRNLYPMYAPDEGGGNPGDPGTGDPGTGDPGAQGGAGAGAEGAPAKWFEGLPDEVKNSEGFAPWKEKSTSDLYNAYVDLEGKSKRAIFVPAEDAGEEAMAAFEAQMRKVLGVPETAEAYEVTYPEGVPKEDPVMSALLAASHENGLNSAQVQGIVDNVVKSIVEHREAQKLVNREAVEKLWGAKFQENVDSAIKGLHGSASDAGLKAEDVDYLAKHLPTDAILVRIFAAVGGHYKEDSFKGGGNQGGPIKSAAEIMYPTQGK